MNTSVGCVSGLHVTECISRKVALRQIGIGEIAILAFYGFHRPSTKTASISQEQAIHAKFSMKYPGPGYPSADLLHFHVHCHIMYPGMEIETKLWLCIITYNF